MGQPGGSLCGDSGFDRKDAAKPFLESVSFDLIAECRKEIDGPREAGRPEA